MDGLVLGLSLGLRFVSFLVLGFWSLRRPCFAHRFTVYNLFPGLSWTVHDSFLVSDSFLSLWLVSAFIYLFYNPIYSAKAGFGLHLVPLRVLFVVAASFHQY
jgi:hypothetical protein